MSRAVLVPNPTGPTAGIHIDENLCIGCNSCARICRIQTILPNPVKGKPPVVAYPDECWYCGVCVEACPTGALEMKLPINQRVLFKDRESGQIFRLDTKDAPDKTFFKAPYGWLDHRELGAVMQELERAGMGGRPVYAYIGKEVPSKVAAAFGEKDTETDYTDRLIRFMKLVGFEDIETNEEAQGHSEMSAQGVTVSVDCSTGEGADYSITSSDLAVLLKRLCVSNFTAVHIWKTLG